MQHMIPQSRGELYLLSFYDWKSGFSRLWKSNKASGLEAGHCILIIADVKGENHFNSNSRIQELMSIYKKNTPELKASEKQQKKVF